MRGLPAFMVAVLVCLRCPAETGQPGGTPVSASAASPAAEVWCEGEYGAHLQGVAGDHEKALFWSFTLTLVKTDLQGRVQAKAKTVYHLGDLTYNDGKVYAAACTSWDRPSNNSKIYVYNADDLKLTEMKPVPEVTYGAGGIEYHDDRFYIVGGADPKAEDNRVYVYDHDFHHVATQVVPTGHTELGVQAITHHGGVFWLACYGNMLFKLDDSLTITGKYPLDFGYGLKSWQGNLVLVGQTPFREEGRSKRWRGGIRFAHLSDDGRVTFVEKDKP